MYTEKNKIVDTKVSLALEEKVKYDVQEECPAFFIFI